MKKIKVIYILYIDIAKFNGENSDKFGCNKGDFYYKYESTARTILRLMWFLDFIIELLE